MLDALRDGGDRPRLVHRLDRDTSGVILLARTAAVAARLAALFRSREVEKTYWAVVVGRPLPVEGQIDQPLKRVSSAFGERTIVADRKDKEGQARLHQLPHAGPCRAEIRLDGSDAADRADPSAARALRQPRRADRGRRQIRRAARQR